MKQLLRNAAIALAAITVASPAIAADEMSKAKSESYPFTAQNASGETGTVTLTAVGTDSTKVTITLKGAPADAQPAHIHPGTCAKLDPKPDYPLASVVNGTSTTVVKATEAKLEAMPFAVNVHKSTTDLATYVACADLKDADDASMKSK